MEKRLTSHFLQPSDYSMTRLNKNPMTAVLNRLQRDHERIEAKVLNELLVLDEAYRSFFKEWLKEFDVQRMAADKLWLLTQDYCMQSDNTCKGPQVRSFDAEDVIMNKYQVHYQVIIGSNLAINRGIAVIRQSLLAFRRECSKLDLSDETSFILGDAFHKPIKFFIELVEELFNYFYSGYLKLDSGARLMDPADLAALEYYQQMLAPCQEFEEYLLQNLSYCHCLRPLQPCPEMSVVAPKTTDIEEIRKRAKLRRCAQRLDKMSKKTEDNLPCVPSSINNVDLEHELRMTELSKRLAKLRECESSTVSAGHERNLVQQMIYALSPSLLPPALVMPSMIVHRE